MELESKGFSARVSTQPAARTRTIVWSRQNQKYFHHLFNATRSLLILMCAIPAHTHAMAVNHNEDHGDVNDHAASSSLSPDGTNPNYLTNDERVIHWKHRRRRNERRTPRNIFLAEQSPTSSQRSLPPQQLQLSEDIRNQNRIDDSLLEESAESYEDTTNTTENGGGGRSKVAMLDLRIINGVSAPETRYPYSASLQYNDQHFCGGSLVAPDLVVTAAHCTTTPMEIVLGRYDLDSPTDDDYEVMGVTEKVVHPDYDRDVVENDLALLVLERESAHPYVRINARGDVPMEGEELRVMVRDAARCIIGRFTETL